MRSRFIVRVIILGCMLGVMLFSVAHCGKSFGRIKTKLGATTTAPIKLPEGAKIQFPMSANWVSYDGVYFIKLHVDLLKAGQVVGSLDCTGYSFRSRGSSRGCGTGSRQTFSDCRTQVPQGGADTVRVSTKLTQGKASVYGLTVIVEEQ